MWLLTLLAGCDGAPDTSDPCLAAPDWDPWGQAFFVQWCDSCHAATSPNRYGAPQDVTFDTLDEILARRDRVHARVMEGTMPPGGGLTEDELADFETWLGCQ